MFNGAVTLGTEDGANVEIHELVGDDNIFIFGMSAEEVEEHYIKGDYFSQDKYNSDEDLREITDQLVNRFFEEVGPNFWSIYDALLRYGDEYFVLEDFRDYMRAWEETGRAYRDENRWLKMSLTNIAKAGHFSSDRTIMQYADEIWHV